MAVDPEVYADSKESAEILGLKDYKAFLNLRDRKSRKTGKNLKKKLNEVLGAKNVSGKWYYRRDLLDRLKKFAGDKTVDAAILKSFYNDEKGDKLMSNDTTLTPAGVNVGDSDNTLSKTSKGDNETPKDDSIEKEVPEPTKNEVPDLESESEPVKDFSPDAQDTNTDTGVVDAQGNEGEKNIEEDNKSLNSTDLKIDAEFQALIPPLSDEEFQQLEENILRDGGIRNPLVIWQGTLIDGHNRYTIATKHNLQFNTVEMNFDSRNDAIIWIIQNQFGRRNLSAYDRVVLALKLKPIFAAKAKENMLATQNNDAAKNLREQRESASKKSCQLTDITESAPPKTARENKTNYQVAKIADVSEDTVRKIEEIEQSATPEIKQALRAGKISINKAYKESKKKNSADSVKEKPKVEPTESQNNSDDSAQINADNVPPKTDSDRKKAQKTAEKLYLDAEEFLNFLTDKNFPADIIKDFHNIRDDFADFMEELKKYVAQAKD